MPGLVVYRFDDAILFCNADYFKMRLLDTVQHRSSAEPARPHWVMVMLLVAWTEP
ncbi:hypothetical protein NJH83_27140 [Pseudomonas chlororaphis]|uniref:hypothetical protein n=1 Tax=Pseudomonas chlororaphis TaxID=587753 RepID=UPI00209A9652|nr:hypothetical protein [Pseudomonas chlororaphis]MCO7613917.1 hypothetical protein [Pseudomonas chlororaphis]